MSSATIGKGGWLRRIAAFGVAILVASGSASNAFAATDAEALQRGQELLAAGQPAEAKLAFEAALAADPSSVEAHLGLARSYYALGEYARAVNEFEAVLRYDNLPRDLQSQAETYDRVAAGYVTPAGWAPFFYGETGVGNYRQNSTKSTDIFGGAGNNDTFLPIRVGGGWSKAVTERHSFNGTLDYRFRWYDDSDRRNDSDLRWNFNLSRPVDDDSLRFGMRGRVSYRGDGQYRNDWGVFGSYDLGFGPNDRVTIGGEVRERRYPRGPLRVRTRDIAEMTVNWSHSLASGRTSFGLGGIDRPGVGDPGAHRRRRLVLGLQWLVRPLLQRHARPVPVVRIRRTRASTTSGPTSRPTRTCCSNATMTSGTSAAAWSGVSHPAGPCARRSSTTGRTATFRR